MTRLLLLSVLAVPAAAREGAAWAWQARARYSASGTKSAVEAGRDHGAFRASSAEYDLRRRVCASSRCSLVVGADFERVGLGHGSGAPLPDHLQSASISLVSDFVFNRKSWLAATLSPGFWGDDALLARDFNLPGSLAFHRLYRSDLHLIAGVSVNAYRRQPAIPFFGAAWRASERWNFHLILPNPRVEYRAYWTPEATVDLFGGLAFSGGQYRVSPELGRRTGRPELGGQILSFTTQQALAGVRAAGAGLEGELYSGWAYARRLEYAGRGVSIRSDGAPALGVSLTGRF